MTEKTPSASEIEDLLNGFEELIEGIYRYGFHHDYCPSYSIKQKPCTCGFDKVLIYFHSFSQNYYERRISDQASVINDLLKKDVLQMEAMQMMIKELKGEK